MTTARAIGADNSVLGTLRLPDYRRLWTGSVASIIGKYVSRELSSHLLLAPGCGWRYQSDWLPVIRGVLE